MSLIDLIKQHASAAAEEGNWSAVASTLNALTTEASDHTLRTGRWLMLQLTTQVGTQNGFPITEADVVLGTLQQATLPRVKAAYDSLVNGGLDLAEQQVQDMLPALAEAANWPSGLAEKVMQAGRRSVAVITTTAEECETEWGLAVVKAKIDAADDAARTESRKASATVQSIVAAANEAWA